MKRSMLIVIGFAFCGAAFADSITETYNCELEDGKTLEDVQAANSTWLAWVRENVNENITSSVNTSIVGDNDGFVFADGYPDIETWAATQTALETDEGQAMEEVFEGVFDCSGNRLWSTQPTE